MDYLVKVGGDLYTYEEYSEGCFGYVLCDVEPLKININPKRPLLRYLRKLVGELRNYNGVHTINNRINLLYKGKGDQESVYLRDMGNDKFDFFVSVYNLKEEVDIKRFSYVRGGIFLENERLDMRKKVYLGRKILLSL